MDDDAALPNAYRCCITQEVMIDPVSEPAGHTYERSAIQKWIERNGTSPMTREPLAVRQLHPNIAIRDLIAEFHDNQRRIALVAAAGADEQKQGGDVMDVDMIQAKQPDEMMRFTHNTVVQQQRHKFVLQIKPPVGVERTPTTLVCVVDLSGSMESDVAVKDAKGNEANHGMCTLDLVKHSLQTVIAMLHPKDRLALVTFHSRAKVELVFTAMDDVGRARARQTVDTFLPQGSTNIWDGLRSALDLVRVLPDRETCNTSVLLFTDGHPFISPPRGEVDALRMTLQHHGLRACRIDTLGFGYDINSKLLETLASTGNHGTYAFIADGGLVGTVMVNNLCNTLITCGLRAQMHLDPCAAFGPERGQHVLHHLRLLHGDSALRNSADGTTLMTLDLGTLRYGMDRVMVLDLGEEGKDVVTAETLERLHLRLTYVDALTGRPCTMPCLAAAADSEPSSEWVMQHELREKSVVLLRHCLEQLGADAAGRPGYENPVYLLSCKEQVKELIRLTHELVDPRPVAAMGVTDEIALARGMLHDLEDQVLQTVSDGAAYARWGQHYLPALLHAHLTQSCVNFKDKGLAQYVSKLFTKLRDEMDFLFVTLPAPVPINQPLPVAGLYDARAANFAPMPAIAPINMHDYNDYDAGCFSADSLILLANKIDRVKISHLQPDTMVATPGGGSAKVLYVTRMALARPHVLVRMAPGIALTPWHPVRARDGTWVFPAHTTGKEVAGGDSHGLCGVDEWSGGENATHVYNLVLDRGHIVLGGSAAADQEAVECVTLAHGFQDPVVQHDFFGTQRVIDAIRALALTNLACPLYLDLPSDTHFVRDSETNLITGMARH